MKLASRKGCKYTRYCDDLVFSGNHRLPAAIAHNHAAEAGGAAVVLGTMLSEAIKKAGVEVNPEKLQLRFKGTRQMVTGLVVNTMSNVPRKFIRDIRMILHVWDKFGLNDATKWYLAKYDKKNRPTIKSPPQLADIVCGKIQYVGSVRGWTSAPYRSLANKLAKLNSSFELTTKPDNRPPANTFVAGVRERHYR